MQSSDLPALGTVLSVWAHPDDEAWLVAGLMALAIQQGQRVVCVTATRGEGGSIDEVRWPSATLGAVREAELTAALAHLGVTEHEFLDLPDEDMRTPLPEGHGRGQLLELMQQVRPDTVFTFGPDGMTGHEAHKSVSRWTTDAFHAAAKPGARLYHARATHEWAALYLPRLSDLGVFLPGTPVVTAEADLDLVFNLPAALLDAKLAALAEHVSQVAALHALYSPEEIRAEAGQETFALAVVQP